MPGSLDHSPADVLRRVLIAIGQGTDPADGDTWPIYASGEPGSPDSVVTIYDTAGKKDGRTMTDGEIQEHHGIQVRVRSASHSPGYAKARAISIALDEGIYDEVITLGSSVYRVHSFSRTGDVMALGKEAPASKRTLFTVNGVVSMRQIA